MAKLGSQPPAKRTKLLDESDVTDDDSDDDAGVQLNGNSTDFKINEEYAKRFEHNKKREEKHRLEEKYGKESSAKRKRGSDDTEDDEEDSSDASEDDDAALATVDVDEEIMATLQAIKSKDPRVYDQSVKFFKEYNPEAPTINGDKKEKPMYLRDYHRENLLAGRNGDEDDANEGAHVQTYAEEQEQLKRELVGSMHAAVKAEDDDEGGFLVAKSKPKHESMPAVSSKSKAKQITEDDIRDADKDPETFLSNFMASRAWLPGEGSRFQAFESDDSEDEKRADDFEEAYNMRFEDPATANEKLQSFARDVGKYGVRREEKSGRAKARERERERKEAEKRERDEGKARLRKLKIEEAQEKVQRIKEAAGLRGQELNLDEWRDVIEGDFDDDKWEQEMKRRFGEDYYADEDGETGSNDDDEEAGDKSSKKKKPKKPKWDDDIDIGDLVPDFDEGDKPQFTVSDEEEQDGGAPLPPDDEEGEEGKKARKTKKDREKEKADTKRAARRERMKIEEMVDAALPLQTTDFATSSSSKTPAIGFRYRETSPTSFGLSARDILFADDSQLNQFAGLKKMAAFRDAEKKSKDKKKLSKKGRLRQWRKDTFGAGDEPTGGFERVLGDVMDVDVPAEKGEGNLKKDARKKKRKNKKVKTQ